MNMSDANQDELLENWPCRGAAPDDRLFCKVERPSDEILSLSTGQRESHLFSLLNPMKMMMLPPPTAATRVSATPFTSQKHLRFMSMKENQSIYSEACHTPRKIVKSLAETPC